MAAKEDVLSTAATPDDLGKAFASAKKAMSVLGITMAKLKAPDETKLAPLMKGKKKAQFKLVADKNLLKLIVDVAGDTNTLGLLDVQAEKDAAKRKVIIESLVASGLADKSALDEFKNSAPDPKVIANLEREIKKLQEAVAKIEAAKKVYEKAATFAEAKKVSSIMAELTALMKKNFTLENLIFLKAVDARMANDKLIDNFIKENSEHQINIAASLRKQIESGAKEASVAAREVAGLIETNDLKELLTAKDRELTAQMTPIAKKLAELLAQKKKLNA